MKDTHFPELSADDIPEQICFTYKGKLYEVAWTNMPLHDKDIPCCGSCPLFKECTDTDEDAQPSDGEPDGVKLWRFCRKTNDLLDDFHNDVGFNMVIDLGAHPEASGHPYHNPKMI